MLGDDNALNKMIVIGLGLMLAIIGGSIALQLVEKQFPASRIIMTAIGGVVTKFIPTQGVTIGGG